MWRIITKDGYRQYPYEPTQEEYLRVGGIGEIQVIENTLWNKEAYAEKLNTAHNELFRQLYTERNYLSMGEIPIWGNDEDYSEESLALQEWWRVTCKLVENHLSEVTEERPIENFINSLPKFDN